MQILKGDALANEVRDQVLCPVLSLLDLGNTSVGDYMELNAVVGYSTNLAKPIYDSIVKQAYCVERLVQRIVPVKANYDVIGVHDLGYKSTPLVVMSRPMALDLRVRLLGVGSGKGRPGLCGARPESPAPCWLPLAGAACPSSSSGGGARSWWIGGDFLLGLGGTTPGGGDFTPLG